MSDILTHVTGHWHRLRRGCSGTRPCTHCASSRSRMLWPLSQMLIIACCQATLPHRIRESAERQLSTCLLPLPSVITSSCVAQALQATLMQMSTAWTQPPRSCRAHCPQDTEGVVHHLVSRFDATRQSPSLVMYQVTSLLCLLLPTGQQGGGRAPSGTWPSDTPHALALTPSGQLLQAHSLLPEQQGGVGAPSGARRRDAAPGTHYLSLRLTRFFHSVLFPLSPFSVQWDNEAVEHLVARRSATQALPLTQCLLKLQLTFDSQVSLTHYK